MITRWDPFREMMTLRRAMDRLIDNSLTDDNTSQIPEWGLPLDVVEEDDSYLVKASVPGIKPDDLDITFNKGVLTIRGELKDESETTKGQYHLRERRTGSFARSISLPTSVKPEDIQASYEDGILSLKLPKAEEVKPKRIPINASNGQRTIEAKNK